MRRREFIAEVGGAAAWQGRSRSLDPFLDGNQELPPREDRAFSARERANSASRYVGGQIAMTKLASGTFAARYEQGVRLRRKTPREKHADRASRPRWQSWRRATVPACPSWYRSAKSGCL